MSVGIKKMPKVKAAQQSVDDPAHFSLCTQSKLVEK